MHPALAALQASRAAAPEPLDNGDEQNPMGTDKSTKEFFVDRNMVKGKVKKGDKVTVTGTVTTTGVSVGVTPDSVEVDDGKDKDGEEGGDEKGADPDLDDDMDEPGEPTISGQSNQ
jgi:hypothetical protein